MQIKTGPVQTSKVKSRGNSEVHLIRTSGGEGETIQAKHWLRNSTRVWSYNSQYMDNRRARHLSYAFAMDEPNSIVGIQGTQQKYKKGDLRVEQWSTEHHDVWELRQKQRTGHSHPAGVAIMAPEGIQTLGQADHCP